MRFLAIVGALALIAAAASAVFFFGGFYSVAASEDDPAVVNWALVRVREAAIDRRTDGTPPIKLDEPATIHAGARKFAELGCAGCHGAPGVNWAKFADGLNPGPPDLKDIGKEDEPAHIFWVVKNGIRMTGMPSFGKAGVPDQEIWQVVAFIKKLPTVSDADFKAWTAAQPAPAAPPSAPPAAAPR